VRLILISSFSLLQRRSFVLSSAFYWRELEFGMGAFGLAAARLCVIIVRFGVVLNSQKRQIRIHLALI
jgi:hypothetical protein